MLSAKFVMGADYVVGVKCNLGAKYFVRAMHVMGFMHVAGACTFWVLYMYILSATGALLSLPVHASCPVAGQITSTS